MGRSGHNHALNQNQYEGASTLPIKAPDAGRLTHFNIELFHFNLLWSTKSMALKTLYF